MGLAHPRPQAETGPLEKLTGGLFGGRERHEIVLRAAHGGNDGRMIHRIRHGGTRDAAVGSGESGHEGDMDCYWAGGKTLLLCIQQWTGQLIFRLSVSSTSIGTLTFA